MKKYNIVKLSNDQPYRYWKLFDDTYVIQYGEGLDVFLLLGKEKALLIDTAFGRGELPNLIEELKGDRELLVVNTHGHFDHTGGNRWFPRVHMHPNALPYANEGFARMEKEWLDNLPYPEYEMVPVDTGHVFDLGGRQVEVIHTPAHCNSSLTFLDHGRKLLFCGDELDSGQANLGDMASVEAFLQNCKKLKEREDEYDFIMPSHNGCPIAKSYMDDFITAAQHIVDGCPDLVSREGLDGYKLGFHGDKTARAQVGDSCINYLPNEK